MSEENCNDIETRVTKVEMTTSSISKDIGDIKDVLNKMAISLQSLAVWEERHANMIETLKRAFKSIEKMEDRVSLLEETITPLKISVEALTKKIDVIEPLMPDIKRASGWVHSAILTLLGIETTALGALIYYVITK